VDMPAVKDDLRPLALAHRVDRFFGPLAAS